MLLISFLLLAAGVRFDDAAEKSGLAFQHVSGSRDKSALLDTMSGGVAWIDFDKDGRLDLYLVNGGRWEDLSAKRRSVSNALFRNRGDGTFQDVTGVAGVGGGRWGMGVTAADFDNDGFPDLYLSNFGPNQLFLNNGDGTFRDVSKEAGISGDSWSSFAAAADFDRDGDLDLYVVNYVVFDPASSRERRCRYRALQVHCGPKGMKGAADVFYRNEGHGTFSNQTEQAGLADVEPSFGLGVMWGDYDDDGDPDLYVANDSRANFLFRNRGDGTFEEVALLSGAAYNDDGLAQAGMGIAWADYDRDGRLDLYVTHFSDDYNTLYRNLGQGLFRDQSYAANLAFSSRQYLGWGTQFFDYDNDGLLDLFVANGHVYPQVDDFQIGTSYLQPKLLYHNQGQGRFVESAASTGAAMMRPAASRGAAFADYDDDGDIDIAVNNLDGTPQLLVNQGGGRSGNWISLALEGVQSNRDAVGARVTIESDSGRQMLEVQGGSGFQSTSDYRLHFGLGRDAKVRRLAVRWPSGETQSFADLSSNARYRLREGSTIRRADGGSEKAGGAGR